MAVPAASISSVRPTSTVFELETLEGLPCGCVAPAYRARPWDVAVVSLEAKGPYCILAGHTTPQIQRPAEPADFARPGSPGERAPNGSISFRSPPAVPSN